MTIPRFSAFRAAAASAPRQPRPAPMPRVDRSRPGEASRGSSRDFSRSLALAAILLLAACAPSMSVSGGDPGGAPAPALAAADVDVATALLRLEDRREYDAGTIESAAGQASPALRRRAALAAGRIGDRRATPLLARLLADADTGVAASAAFALGELGDTSAAVTALVPYVAAERIATAP